MTSHRKRGQTSLRIHIEPELNVQIERAAAERRLPVTEFVVAILRDALAAGQGHPSTDNRVWSGLSTPSFARDWESEEDRVYDNISQG